MYILKDIFDFCETFDGDESPVQIHGLHTFDVNGVDLIYFFSLSSALSFFYFIAFCFLSCVFISQKTRQGGECMPGIE